MIDRRRLAWTLGLFVLLVPGCSSAPERAEAPPARPTAPSPVDGTAPVARQTQVPPPTQSVPAEAAGGEPAEPAPPVATEEHPSTPDPAVPAKKPPAAEPAFPAPPEPASAPPSSTPAPPAEPVSPEPEPPSPAGAETGESRAQGVVDPGGPVEVAATKAGLTRIGVKKCKLCHKVQYASWSETAHATRTPPLDCEGCHGPGSEYKGLAVMKDPEKARAAGLVRPTETFCSRCHKSKWSEDMLRRTHAHKDEAS